MKSTMSAKPWFSRLRGLARYTHTAIANPSADNTTTRKLDVVLGILPGGSAIEVGSLVELSQEIRRAQQHAAHIRSHVQRLDPLAERAALQHDKPEDPDVRAAASHEGDRV